jgi:D-beta-D-heptose 7-phosphate kinase / D-beta-D-heptose 1-phosphate adenosyltransferase
MRLTVVGDTLLDCDVRGSATRLCPDAPVPVIDEEQRLVRPGGAGLAAVLAAADGHLVTLVTALADDEGGDCLRAELARRGIEVAELELYGSTPEKIRMFAGEHQLVRLDRGSSMSPVGPVTEAARSAISSADGVLVSDYGGTLTSEPALRAALSEVTSEVRVVWDPHPRGAAPVPGVTVATPNESETELFAPSAEGRTRGIAARAQSLRRAWEAEAVCTTRGARGALLVLASGVPVTLAAAPTRGGDPCGAGDRFACTLAAALAVGESVTEAAAGAVAAASEFVAAGGARAALSAGDRAGADGTSDALAIAERVRAAGGTVVATGGCFDLLHAGHVETLAAARALGDCLVVCLNSDASVQRLKGSSRPLMSQEDRARVLTALGCVDAVVVFDEDTPERVLRGLRPHVWAKGGDYEGVRLPESGVVGEWGGRTVVLPYLSGRSTTRLIEEAMSGA